MRGRQTLGYLLAHSDGRGGGAPFQGPLRHAQQGTLRCCISYAALFFLVLPLFLALAFGVAPFSASASLWCCPFPCLLGCESPLDTQLSSADAPGQARRGNNSKGFKDFSLKAKARVWPGLSYMCHVGSTADEACLVAIVAGGSPGGGASWLITKREELGRF